MKKIERNKRIVEMASNGSTNAQIAAECQCSERTVKRVLSDAGLTRHFAVKENVPSGTLLGQKNVQGADVSDSEETINVKMSKSDYERLKDGVVLSKEEYENVLYMMEKYDELQEKLELALDRQDEFEDLQVQNQQVENFNANKAFIAFLQSSDDLYTVEDLKDNGEIETCTFDELYRKCQQRNWRNSEASLKNLVDRHLEVEGEYSLLQFKIKKSAGNIITQLKKEEENLKKLLDELTKRVQELEDKH